MVPRDSRDREIPEIKRNNRSGEKYPLELLISCQIRLLISVPEMPAPGEYHRHVVFVGGGNHLSIPY